MDPSTYGFYLVVLIFILMVWYAGFEGTMRLFRYVDLQLQYTVVRIRMWRMQRKLEKGLGLPPKNYQKLLEKHKNDQ